MKNIRGLFAVSTSLVLAGIGFVHTDSSVSATGVSTEHCSADVTPSTGVSVLIANDDDCVIKFTSSTTVTWTRPSDVSTFEILVVGGGGGGGAHPHGDPGGGGGGGVVHIPSTVLTDASYEIFVGAGGIGNDRPNAGYNWYGGGNGGNSTFASSDSTALITADGGGGGGGAYITERQGGSGGGGHCGGGPSTATKGTVDPSISNAVVYGNEGGKSDNCGTGAGGGGGASTRGQDGTATKAGDGGEGIALSILGQGSSTVFGSGGGGAGAYRDPQDQQIEPGQGGTNGGDGKPDDGPVSARHNGVDGTGSGGGAQLCPFDLPCIAGKGGDGIVVIRYTPTNRPVRTTTPPVAATVAPMVAENQDVSVVESAPQVPTRRINTNAKAQPQKSTQKKVVTATTIPSPTTTVPTKPVAPQAPEAAPGEAKLVIDGEAVELELSRRDNQLVMTNGSLSSSLSAITPQGDRRALDEGGNIRFEEGDSLELLATGFAGDSDLEVWVFSTPRDLGLIRTSAAGEAESRLTVPTDIEPGNHKVVISGTSKSGSKVVVAVGIIVGATSDGVSTAEKFFIALPITAAIIAGLIIPTRRRRKTEIS